MRNLLAISALWAAAMPFLLCTLLSADEGLKKIVTVEGITEYRLDNGVRALLFPDSSTSKVTVNATVFVGSRHEGYGETGMAHLLEHMLFKGTPDHPKIPKVLKDRGADFNGTTWVDRTNYYETMPGTDKNLEFGIRLEADRLVNCFIKREDLVSIAKNLFDVVGSGAVKIDVAHTYALKDARKAHEELESRGTTGSLILKP